MRPAESAFWFCCFKWQRLSSNRQRIVGSLSPVDREAELPQRASLVDGPLPTARDGWHGEFVRELVVSVDHGAPFGGKPFEVPEQLRSADPMRMTATNRRPFELAKRSRHLRSVPQRPSALVAQCSTALSSGRSATCGNIERYSSPSMRRRLTRRDSVAASASAWLAWMLRGAGS